MLRAHCNKAIIGRSGLHILKKKSPFASLLLEIAQAITDMEFSNMKLYVFIDRKHTLNKKLIQATRFPADLLLLLEDREVITKTNVQYLEQLLLSLGRKDLMKSVETYAENIKEKDEATVPKKVVESQFTRLKTIPEIEQCDVLMSSQESEMECSGGSQQSNMSISDDEKMSMMHESPHKYMPDI